MTSDIQIMGMIMPIIFHVFVIMDKMFSYNKIVTAPWLIFYASIHLSKEWFLPTTMLLLISVGW